MKNLSRLGNSWLEKVVQEAERNARRIKMVGMVWYGTIVIVLRRPVLRCGAVADSPDGW